MELREAVKFQGRDALRIVEPPEIPEFMLLGRPIGVIRAGDVSEQERETATAATISVHQPVQEDAPQVSLFDDRSVKEAPAQGYTASPTSDRPPLRDLKPYPAMKDSRVPWLGQVPEHWRLQRMKTLLRERVQKGFPNEPLLAATQSKGVVRKEQYESRTVLALKDLHLLKLVRVGDFVISLRSFQGGIEYAREQGIISPAYTVLYVTVPEMHGFLARLFKSTPYVENLSLFVTGIRQGQNIDYEKLARAQVPVPTPAEQAAIVRFLGHADRRIRRYIRAKQNLIKLLEQQKQAIIHRAVTCGFDANVPFKPSGLDWVGDVPEQWDVRRLKSLVQRIDHGVSPQAENYLAGRASWGVLKAGCVNRGVFREEEHKRLPSGFDIDPSLAVRVGDVLVSRASGSPELVGSVGRVRALSYRLILSDKTFRPIFREGIEPDFMVLAMNSRYYREQVRQAISGAEGLANNLPLSSLRSFRFVVPKKVAEQQFIVREVDATVSSLQATVVKAEREIALLREYRTRLVADVVTGKLDVREAAARLPAEAEELEPLDETDAEDEGDEAAADDVNEVSEETEA
jgi:type I restriction enzyme S subunit